MGINSSEYSALIGQLGLKGFKRVTTSWTGKAYAIKAIGADLVLSAATVSKGDAPQEEDVISKGDIIFAPFTSVTIGSGTAYIYTV